ncbi:MULTISPECIES: PP2C family protein-serine/threonine phosphatase [unclassified Synechococcus]|uniref:PP2C family protein-serine/threonine phosphatase n=1 Tax=unclassified Synechococcus TaxID=2626047 RepID=UPI001E5A92E2|nr:MULTISPECIES: SpoIIE family protein phosphatase [unclassified Synechococcus]MEA5423493.1 SpoIIE family protein phosphatase [Synechococcus sp. CCY9202]
MRAPRGRSLSTKPPPRAAMAPSPLPASADPAAVQPDPEAIAPPASAPLTATASLRQLLDSLSREQRRNGELLASLGFALRSFTNLSRFLELVALVAARLVEAEGALLVVFHPDGRLWREQLQASPPDRCAKLLRQIAALPDSDLQAQASEEAVVQLLDQLVARLLGEVQVFGTSVVARSNQRGRLYVFSGPDGLCWSEVNQRHIQLVADLTGVALENELLLADMRRHERLDRQLSSGAEIQAQLLPDHCPVIEGVELAARCRPAFQVGGDYYDFIPTRPQLMGRRREQGRWALVMGDVMGKGVPAGLLMTLLRGMLRAEVLSGHAPDRILHDLNQLAQEDLAHSHRFVTLFYSDFDPRTRLLRYANAAHNPPLIWRRQSGRVERLDAPGLLIGLQSEAEYGCGQLVLEPGDVLLYYTDGVTEAPGLTGERFEEERLVRALHAACRSGVGAQGILDHLFARLDRFVGDDRQPDDDASLVVLKVREEVMLPSLPAAAGLR